MDRKLSYNDADNAAPLFARSFFFDCAERIDLETLGRDSSLIRSAVVNLLECPAHFTPGGRQPSAAAASDTFFARLLRLCMDGAEIDYETIQFGCRILRF